MITGLSHVSLIVPDLQAACDRMTRVYGLNVGAVMVNEQQGVRMVYADLGNAKIEMIQPLPSNVSLMRFLERHPEGGLHHLALCVDSLPDTCAQLATHAVTPISAADARNVHGQAIAFVHPRHFQGALLELEENS
jgi:methylmalonyl-CoA/ethylmalonyl-CoA epimerase